MQDITPHWSVKQMKAPFLYMAMCLSDTETSGGVLELALSGMRAQYKYWQYAT